MARTITEIKMIITGRFMANEILASRYGFNAQDTFEMFFSKVSLENILVDIVAFSIWSLEQIFSIHQREVDSALSELKPHTARWYRIKALAFQYGFDLLEDSDQFNNEGFNEQQIAASKIIKYSAVTESTTESRLIVKIATETAEELQPLSPMQLEAFTTYINEVKDAGVRISVINYLPDILRLSIRIVRDPLVLDSEGTHRVLGGKPVEQAIREFLRDLPFSGELRLQELANKIEAADGVLLVQIDSAQSKWIDSSINDYGNWQAIDIRTIPVSGYFKLEDFNNIVYVV